MILVKNDFYLHLLRILCSALTFGFTSSLMKTKGNETSANSTIKKDPLVLFLKQNKGNN